MTLEAFLARLYVDGSARRRFLEDSFGEASAAGLDPVDAERLTAIDREGLELAAASFARKRAAKKNAATRWPRFLRFALFTARPSLSSGRRRAKPSTR